MKYQFIMLLAGLCLIQPSLAERLLLVGDNRYAAFDTAFSQSSGQSNPYDVTVAERIVDSKINGAGTTGYIIDRVGKVTAFDLATGAIVGVIQFPQVGPAVPPTGITLTSFQGVEIVAALIGHHIHWGQASLGLDLGYIRVANPAAVYFGLGKPEFQQNSMTLSVVMPSGTFGQYEIANVDFSSVPPVVTHIPYGPGGALTAPTHITVAEPFIAVENIIVPQNLGRPTGGFDIGALSYIPLLNLAYWIPSGFQSTAESKKPLSKGDLTVFPNLNDLILFVPSTLSWFKYRFQTAPFDTTNLDAIEIQGPNVWAGVETINNTQVIRMNPNLQEQVITTGFHPRVIRAAKNTPNSVLVSGISVGTALRFGVEQITCLNADCSQRVAPPVVRHAPGRGVANEIHPF